MRFDCSCPDCRSWKAARREFFEHIGCGALMMVVLAVCLVGF